MRALAAAAMLLVAACGGASQAAPGGPSSERLTLRPAGSVDGASVGYVEYLPPGYGKGPARPLLVFLHGTDESGAGSRAELERVLKLGIPQLIRDDEWPERRPFVVLAPQYAAADAESCRLADRVASFLEFARREYEVDRVYLTGISCGAIGAWDYLAAHGGAVVDAAVAISGHAIDAIARAGCALGRVPVWTFHGDADEIVPTEAVAGPIEELRGCTEAPVDLRLTVYPDVGHDAWTPTYARDDVFAWLLAHDQ